jgi:endo-1,4-beta-xylanase
MRTMKLYAAATAALALLTGVAVWAATTPEPAEASSGRAPGGSAVTSPANVANAANTANAGADGGPALNQSLRALARPHNLRVGTAVDTTALANDATYNRIVGEQFSTVTPENVMKWQLVEAQRGQFDWAAADALVTYAQNHQQLVRGHTLVWHNQLPTWLTAGTFTSDELRAILRQHVIDEVTHFKGKIWQWDVVNEAFNDDGTLRDTLWLRQLGPGYIADAFRWAHQADRRALLFYNDYNIEGITPKSTAVYDLVRKLRAEGVPIDGVGVQGHFGTQYGFNGDVPENLARFAALGLDVAVTEADVRSVLPMDNPKTQAQAQGYSVLMQACLLTRRCLSYTVWGFSDKYQWVPGVFAGQGSAALYDANFAPKPAFRALQVDLALAAQRQHD